MAVTILPFAPTESTLQGAVNLNKGMQDMFQTQIQNQYLPEKLRLANALSQNELNYAPQMSEATIAEKRALAPYYGAMTSHLQNEDKFLPLKYAIEAENSRRANQRFGQAFQLKQWLNSLPEAERADWIAGNQEAYMQMGADIANGPGAPGQNNSILTPEFLSNFFKPGTQQVPQNMPPGLPMTAAQQNAVAQKTQGMPMTVNPASIYPQGQPMQPQPSAIAANSVDPSQVPDYLRNPAQQQQQQIAPAGIQQPPQQPYFRPQTPEQAQRAQNTLQMAANRKSVGSKINNRADAAVALEKWLGDNQAEYAPRINNAAQYAGALGRLKNKADAIKATSPEAYQDYVWAKTSFQGQLANLTKQMEQLNGDQNQREELKELAGNIDRMDLDPKASVNNFNKTISTLQDLSDAVFKAAEPVYPGAYQKIHGFKRFKNNYLDVGSSAKATAPEGSTQTIRGKTYKVINGEWHEA